MSTRTPSQGQSIRSGEARIKFDPDWSPTLPYATYVRGVAGPRFGTLSGAMHHLSGPRGANRWTDWE